MYLTKKTTFYLPEISIIKLHVILVVRKSLKKIKPIFNYLFIKTKKNY